MFVVSPYLEHKITSVGIFFFSFHKVTLECQNDLFQLQKQFVLNFMGEPSNISHFKLSHNGISVCPCVVKTIFSHKSNFYSVSTSFQKWSIYFSRILNIYSNSVSYIHLPWLIKNLHIFQTFSYLSIYMVSSVVILYWITCAPLTHLLCAIQLDPTTYLVGRYSMGRFSFLHKIQNSVKIISDLITLMMVYMCSGVILMLADRHRYPCRRRH